MLLKRDAKCKAKCRSYEKDKNRFRDARVECMLPAYLILTLPCGDDLQLPGPNIVVRCTSIEEVATQRKKANGQANKTHTHSCQICTK